MNATQHKVKTPASVGKPTVEEQLLNDGSRFDFFQAASLLEQAAKRQGAEKPLPKFKTPVSTAFPASPIDAIDSAEKNGDPPSMVVNFMGLTGPSGMLPRHYTELLIQIERQVRDKTKHTLSAWYDLFNNRLIGQLYRAWAKCRIDRNHTRPTEEQPETGGFHGSLLSLIGLGLPSLGERLRVDANDQQQENSEQAQSVDRVRDAALLRHAGMLARRQRSAAQIESMLSTHFRVPIQIEQFRGQWLELEPSDQTRLGMLRSRKAQANRLGQDAVLGSRVWNRQSRIRVRIGPLSQQQFDSFLPDMVSIDKRSRFIMLCQLVRLAVGIEIDFDVQLILQREAVASLELSTTSDAGNRGRLGWNTWVTTQPFDRDGDEPIFEPIEVTKL